MHYLAIISQTFKLSQAVSTVSNALAILKGYKIKPHRQMMELFVYATEVSNNYYLALLHTSQQTGTCIPILNTLTCKPIIIADTFAPMTLSL